ncbi:MAG TPA: hypothetical protein VH328_04860 [Burkholderiaceae bacterium]|jgi:hypothetical protein|nr:hypothetical protein [Burkholderiaceae bacterium]
MPTTAQESASHTAYGVTKPVGHVLISFPTEEDALAAREDLHGAGFGEQDIAYFTAEQMKARTEEDMRTAGFLASVGQELNLVKAQNALARAGHAFLSVHAPEDDRARGAARIAERHHADRAQRYGRLIIEELIEPGTGEAQVAESPARGLDPQTPSGRELS